MEEPALLGPPADVHLVRFMLSKSAASYHSYLGGILVRWLQKLDSTNPTTWMSHHALKIHGDYYELCRDDPHQLPFLGTARFRKLTAERAGEFQDRQKWTKADLFLGTTTLTPDGIQQRLEQYEQNLPTDYLQFNNSPLKPRPYSLLNSNCQHFILDLAFCLQVEFDAHGLAEVWRGTTIVKRVLAPTMGLLGFVLSALAFLAESKWAKITSYTVSGLYYIVFKVVLVQDLTTSTERQTLLHALHFYDIDHRSEYLCRQFRKLRYRIRSTDHDFYPETEISLYGSRMLYAFFLAYYIYTGSAPRTLGFLFLALLVSCVTNDITDYLLLVWHPLAEERRAVNKRLDKARRSLLRNWRHLRWPDLLYTLNTTDKRPPTSGLERMELHIEQTRLGQRGVEAGLLGDRDDEQVIIHCDKPPPHSIRCLFKCGFDCTLGSRARSKAEKYWRDRDLPIGEKWEADLL